MENEYKQMNSTVRRCVGVEYMCSLYNIQLLEQRERIENLKKKLDAYNKNIEQHNSVFNNIVKRTDGFFSNIICVKCCFVDDKVSFYNSLSKHVLVLSNTYINNWVYHEELNLINNFNKIHSCRTCKCKKIQSKKYDSNRCNNTIVYKKTNFYVDENKNKMKKKKKKLKKKKKSLLQNENIYGLISPYDTIEAKELYDIYKKKKNICS
ncbi:conserved protein, unknown function [Hepatocystis sp. ex Piliocolobus tephrosceles]|nr:conserved protein, unknown function [Hepatocystis sp. ex Piliocolobus tephrosceles]